VVPNHPGRAHHRLVHRTDRPLWMLMKIAPRQTKHIVRHTSGTISRVRCGAGFTPGVCPCIVRLPPVRIRR
jgi:hypothetical protein